jgi:hypothetical protein
LYGCIVKAKRIQQRSQLGNRDSEIAVIIEDTDTVESKMNGQPVRNRKKIDLI